MKVSYWILAVVTILALGAYFYYGQTGQPSETPTRVMSIESYMEQNISELSPVKEVLGGTFYVTDIQAKDGRGTVSYEDGHIAFVADFRYSIDVERSISILSFDVRE